MTARIYRPSKTAMQSGKANAKQWVLEFDAETPRRVEPLMGWTSADDMRASQVRLTFETKEQAISYAQEHGILHQVIDAKDPAPVYKSYSDNFATRRRQPWTH